MTCRELVDFLMAYLEGELPAEQATSFREHMDACPPCVTYVDTYRETVRLGRQICAEGDEIPEDVPEQLVQAVLAARRGGAA